MLVSLGLGLSIVSSSALNAVNKFNGNSLSLSVRDQLGPMMIYALGLWSKVGDSFEHGLVFQGGRQIVRGTDIFGSQESAEHSMSQFRVTYEPALRIIPFPATFSKRNFAQKIEKKMPLLSFYLGAISGVGLFQISSSLKSLREKSEVTYSFVNTGVFYGGTAKISLAWPKSRSMPLMTRSLGGGR